MKEARIDPFLLENFQFFKHVRLFFDLNDEQIKTVLEQVQVEKFPPNTYLMKEGTVGDKMFILMQGEVEIYKSLILPEWMHMFNKPEKSLLHFTERDHPFFGEMVMLGDQSKRSASIITRSHCTLASLSKNAFDRLVSNDAQLAQILFRNMACELAERLRKANRDILKLTTALSIALKG